MGCYGGNQRSSSSNRMCIACIVFCSRNGKDLWQFHRSEETGTRIETICLAKGVITHGLELMLALFNIAQGVVATIIKSAGFDKMGKTKLPEEIVTAVEDCVFLESIQLLDVTLIGILFI